MPVKMVLAGLRLDEMFRRGGQIFPVSRKGKACLVMSLDITSR